MDTQELLHLHAKAKEYFKIKMAKINSSRVLLQPITLADIYLADISPDRRAKLMIDGIPPHYQLDFYFKTFNEFAASGYVARKHNQRNHIAFATWFYNMDKQHNFACFHERVRWNVVLAVILTTSKEANDICHPDTLPFREGFLDAWINAMIRQNDCIDQEAFVRIWHHTNYDLTFFGTKDRLRMYNAISELKKNMPPFPNGCTPDEFLEGAKHFDQKQLRQFGPAWALQWVMGAERDMTQFKKQDKDQVMTDGDSLQSAFSGLGGPAEEDTIPLTYELFQRDWVKALLTPIEPVYVDNSYTIGPRAQNWIAPSTAIELLEGRLAEILDIADIFAKLIVS
ncbi:hypothetical protein K504DRAFT_492336 [Pleomassaria siparia CBS 279.74]|uniref:Uncharacterized protein n=1 Tax=Pleomassaria siparia CBS 279.74 TaxID=1314801 RepID=A0A6G1K582_9PLEO|nr:hypothetical protein K504DRAFT_492336 [Pleomassaria siparia CBS 279.74]